MALIIETGAGVPNANSYGDTDGPTTIAAARSYAADRGVTLSATDSVVTAYLINGTDYLESFALRYVGLPADFTQSLSWPRQCVQFDPDTPFPDDEIPPILIQALYQTCIEQSNGIVLQPSTNYAASGGFVTMKKVDVIEKRFSEHIGTTALPVLPKVSSLLAGLLIPVAALKVVRI